MKCPRCGLVHAAAEQVCRRCEIDLRTGEPRPRSQSTCLAPTPVASPLDRLRRRLAKPDATAAAPDSRPPSFPSGAPIEPRETRPAHAPAHATAPVLAKTAAVVTFFRAQKKRVRFLSFLRSRPDEMTISCVQCSQPMTVVRENHFPFWQPLLLYILGAVLLVAGLFFHLLIITGVLAVVAGIFFFRLGGAHWHCAACGFVVPRSR
jgi:hypothetical protein